MALEFWQGPELPLVPDFRHETLWVKDATDKERQVRAKRVMARARKYEMGLKYYRTFSSYRIPFKPQGELEYSETKGLKSFYIGYHDTNGCLIQFVKLLLERISTASVSLTRRGEPGQEVFFRVQRGCNGEGTGVGDPIDYAATETSTEFFQGTLDASGTSAQLFLMRKEQVFRDFYLYEPSGRPKVRLLLRRNSGTSVWYFDEKGKPHAGDTAASESAASAVQNLPTEPLRLELTGLDADAATAELKREIDSEEIPGIEVNIEKQQIAPTVVRIGVVLAPILAPLVVEAIYRWLTAGQKADLKVELQSGERHADASADHFDRKEYVELLSGLAEPRK